MARERAIEIRAMAGRSNSRVRVLSPSAAWRVTIQMFCWRVMLVTAGEVVEARLRTQAACVCRLSKRTVAAARSMSICNDDVLSRTLVRLLWTLNFRPGSGSGRCAGRQEDG